MIATGRQCPFTNTKDLLMFGQNYQLLYFRRVNYLVLIVMPSKDILESELQLELHSVICKKCS